MINSCRTRVGTKQENDTLIFCAVTRGAYVVSGTWSRIQYSGYHQVSVLADNCENPNAVYACINFNEAFCPEELEKKSICIGGDIAEVLWDMI